MTVNSEDTAILQSGGECLRAFLSVGGRHQLEAWRDESGNNGLSYVFQVSEKSASNMLIEWDLGAIRHRLKARAQSLKKFPKLDFCIFEDFLNFECFLLFLQEDEYVPKSIRLSASPSVILS